MSVWFSVPFNVYVCAFGDSISRDALTTSDTLCLLHPQERLKKKEKTKIALNTSDVFIITSYQLSPVQQTTFNLF